MRAWTLLVCIAGFGLAANASAIPYVPPPEPVYEAPIDRALENVAADTSLAPAQREQLLGRLNLLAYARNDPRFTFVRSDNRLNASGSVLCREAGGGMPRIQGEPAPQFGADERCARFEFHLGPQREVAEQPQATPSQAALARLEAARRHYAMAVRLDKSNLRARLGYAYVLDRLGRMSSARQQLRTIIRLGLPQLANTPSDWETHAVLSESVEHLAHLARSANDRAQVRRLQERLVESPPAIYVTPIVVPLADAPFGRLIDTTSSVAFDFAGTGDTRAQGWLTPDAAWLVWDPHWRGDIRSGFDMIGQRTWAVFWSDGFEALRALDDNRDGELTGAELGGLSLWRDENRNGVSDPGEVLPANVHGITGLAVRGRATRPGLITAPSGVRFENGSTRPLYDWTPGLADTAPVS